jgi:hypothetical protein
MRINKAIISNVITIMKLPVDNVIGCAVFLALQCKTDLTGSNLAVCA